jgi:hypothetical protein
MKLKKLILPLTLGAILWVFLWAGIMYAIPKSEKAESFTFSATDNEGVRRIRFRQFNGCWSSWIDISQIAEIEVQNFSGNSRFIVPEIKKYEGG